MTDEIAIDGKSQAGGINADFKARLI